MDSQFAGQKNTHRANKLVRNHSLLALFVIHILFRYIFHTYICNVNVCRGAAVPQIKFQSAF